MDIELKLSEWKQHAVNAVQKLSPDDLYNLWLASGAVLAVFFAWLSHRIMRKALGHVKFRGTWYDADQWEVMITMIDEDSKRGNRVMRHDEMAALRRWRFGSSKAIIHGSGYF